MTTEPVGRPMRASDQDRTEAVLALTDHFTAGRLDKDEFEERMGAAQQAVFLHDLDPLFADLGGAPAQRPTTAVRSGGPVARPRLGGRRPAFVPLLVAAVISAVVLTGGHVLWLLLPVWWFAFAATHRRRWQAHAVAARPEYRTGGARRGRGR